MIMMMMLVLVMKMRQSSSPAELPFLLQFCQTTTSCVAFMWNAEVLHELKKSTFKIDGGGRNSFPAGSDFANFRPGSDMRQVRRKDEKSVRTFATNWVDICFKYRKHRKAVPNFTSDYKGGEIQLLSSPMWERTMCTTWVQQRARTKKLWHSEETDFWTRLASAWAF